MVSRLYTIGMTLWLFITLAQARKRIVVSNLLPLVECNYGETLESTATGPQNMKGFSISLIEEIMDNTFEHDTYYFEWMHFDEIENEVKYGNAWAAIGGIAIDTRRLEEGFQFTKPILHTGLHIVSLGSLETGYWSWLKSFTPGLWAAILVTAFGLGFVLWLVERVWIKTQSEDQDEQARESYIEAFWHSMSSITMMSDKETRKAGSRIIILIFWFMVLILTASYTADLTARLGVAEINTDISDTDDLDGVTVGIDKEYAGAAENYGATEVLYDEHEEIETMIQDLKDGNLKALVLDTPIAHYRASLDCDLYEVGEEFFDISYGVMFPSTMDEDEIEELDVTILNLFEYDAVGALENEFFRVINEDDDWAAHAEGEPFTVFEFAGVFFLMAGAIGIAGMIHVGQLLYKKHKQKKQKMVGSIDTPAADEINDAYGSIGTKVLPADTDIDRKQSDDTGLGKTEGTYRPQQDNLGEVLRHNAHLRRIIATLKHDVSELSTRPKKDV